MAIIRIKRTTGNSLPTGLTFGEMAFIGRTGGATANRLYIAGPEGVCVWIGAQILNSPTFWSGLTAQTTIPTVSAVRDALIAGVGSQGALTFANDLGVNIGTGKWFGKYTRGQTIPAQGQTVKWVLEDALSETIPPIGSLSSNYAASGGISFGQTTGTVTLSVSYTILTAGSSASGTTLEYRWGDVGAWTSLSTALKNDSLGTNQQYTNTFNHTFDRLVDTASGGRWAGHFAGATALNYRWSVRDTAGATFSTTISIAPTTTAVPNLTWNSVTPTSLRTGIFGSTGGATETETNREKGNTFTNNIGFTITRSNQYIPLTGYILQARRYVNGAFDSYAGITSTTLPNPATNTISGITFRPTTAGASLDRLEFQIQITDEYWDATGPAPATTTYTHPTTRTVNFNYMAFYGATTNNPLSGTPATNIRGLSSGLVRAPDPTVAPFGEGGNDTASGTLPNSGTIAGAIGPIGANTWYVYAVPDGITSTFFDTSLQQNVNFNFGGEPNTTVVTIPDASGVNKNYNVYVLNVAVPPNDSRHYSVTNFGTVTQP